MRLARKIRAREKERMRNITERVESMFPNLEEGKIFAESQGTLDIARARVQEAESTDTFQRAEIVYYDFFEGVCTEQVYVIGYGPIISRGREEQPAILFLRRHVGKPDRRGRYVGSVEFHRLKSFKVSD